MRTSYVYFEQETFCSIDSDLICLFSITKYCLFQPGKSFLNSKGFFLSIRIDAGVMILGICRSLVCGLTIMSATIQIIRQPLPLVLIGHSYLCLAVDTGFSIFAHIQISNNVLRYMSKKEFLLNTTMLSRKLTLSRISNRFSCPDAIFMGGTNMLTIKIYARHSH